MNLTEADVRQESDGTIKTTTLRLERQNGAWTVNGTTWDKIVASNYQFWRRTPLEGTVEKWIIQNKSGGWFHPLHIHLVDFKVLSPQRWRRPCRTSVVRRTSSTPARTRRIEAAGAVRQPAASTWCTATTSSTRTTT